MCTKPDQGFGNEMALVWHFIGYWGIVLLNEAARPIEGSAYHACIQMAFDRNGLEDWRLHCLRRHSASRSLDPIFIGTNFLVNPHSIRMVAIIKQRAALRCSGKSRCRFVLPNAASQS